jgi:hypothetical protein
MLKKEKSLGENGLALSVYRENDVLLTASFIANKRRWVVK